jgi:hypothetical protein
MCVCGCVWVLVLLSSSAVLSGVQWHYMSFDCVPCWVVFGYLSFHDVPCWVIFGGNTCPFIVCSLECHTVAIFILWLCARLSGIRVLRCYLTSHHVPCLVMFGGNICPLIGCSVEWYSVVFLILGLCAVLNGVRWCYSCHPLNGCRLEWCSVVFDWVSYEVVFGSVYMKNSFYCVKTSNRIPLSTAHNKTNSSYKHYRTPLHTTPNQTLPNTTPVDTHSKDDNYNTTEHHSTRHTIQG